MVVNTPASGTLVRLLRAVMDAEEGSVGELRSPLGHHDPDRDMPTDLFSVRTKVGLVVVQRQEIEEA